MQKRMIAALAMVGSFSWTTTAWASNHVVSEKDKKFSTSSLSIKIGDTVEFRNEDTVYHNVFSLSDVTTFDLGSYGPGERRKVNFNMPGKIMIECAVHRDEKMSIEVK